MKMDRLIGILSILLQREAVTAPMLAKRFEVSVRTIRRDVDQLCRAGIPVVTKQGAGGGLSIMEGYKIDRTLLTGRELQDILAGLRSLDSVNGTNRYGMLMEKLSAGSSNFLSGSQSVFIDLSSWYKSSLAPKIELIREGIDTARELRFCYYSSSGEGERQIRPYYLIFRWSSWYVWGFCTARQDFRLFKLNRMDALALTDTRFEKQPAPLPDLQDERIFPGGICVKALFRPNCKWRLVEEFGVNCFTVQPDGRLLFHADYTNKENLLTWLLTFRDEAELLEPRELREELREALASVLKLYEEGK